VVQMLLDMGDITESEVRGHPDRNRVLKCLGMEDDIKPKVSSFQLARGDMLIMCTDGLWEYFLNEDFINFFIRYGTLSSKEMVALLISDAKELAQDAKKDYDNLTGQIIKVT